MVALTYSKISIPNILNPRNILDDLNQGDHKFICTEIYSSQL